MSEHSGAWAAARESTRLRHEVVLGVRRSSRGNDVGEVARQLGREFTAAGIPQPPETVHIFAAGIASGRWPGLPLAGQLLHLVVNRELPPGLRAKSRHLPGGRWAPVTVMDTVMARAALSRWLGMQRWVTDHVEGPGPAPINVTSVRLIAIPDLDGGTDQVAALLGDAFAGTLPADLAAVLLAAVAEADAADERLMAHARIEEIPHGYTLEVAIPDPAG